MPDTPSSQSSRNLTTDAKRVAVIGASGYGGIQALRLLRDHPNFKISFLAGERSAGKRWSDVAPFISLPEDPLIQDPDPSVISEFADYALLSLPNGLSSQLTPELLERNVKVIDLSADYRYRSLNQWNKIYSKEAEIYSRQDNELCAEAVYGLAEWNKNSISSANLIACPGCFPTASLLPLLPFLKQGLIDNEGLIIDAKTGTSGGGRSAKENLLLSECSEAITPYGVVGHRHTSEIEQESSLVSGKTIQLQFSPNLVPMVRGLLVTVYAKLRDPGLTAEDCKTVLEAMYREHPCITVLPVGVYPSTKWVRQTNKALLSVQVDKRTSSLILMCVIDNLIKGQAGQAIQCLNIMEGIKEECGLPLDPFYP